MTTALVPIGGGPAGQTVARGGLTSQTPGEMWPGALPHALLIILLMGQYRANRGGYKPASSLRQEEGRGLLLRGADLQGKRVRVAFIWGLQER